MKKTLYFIFLLLICSWTPWPVLAAWQPEVVIGGKLSTILYVPSTPPVLAGKRALMVSLHGCRQTNELFHEGTNWSAVAERYGMVVALPESSGEGKYGKLGCWNFMVGLGMSRTSSDAKYLLDLVEGLLEDSKLNIDPAQVYITGISSGGAMVSSLACLAPEVFAGAGVSAGTPPGADGAVIDKVNMLVFEGVSNCRALSNKEGAKAQPWLSSQIHSTICGSLDVRVSPLWCERVSDIMATTYGESTLIRDCSGGKNTADLFEGSVLKTYCDRSGPRASSIMVKGLGHAWSGGAGSSGGGVNFDHTHIDYQAYVTDFFFKNNRRVVRDGASKR